MQRRAIHVLSDVPVLSIYGITGGKDHLPLKRGKIQLQSEGAETFFRNVTLRQIDKLPVVNVKNRTRSMYLHIFLFRWKAAATSAHRDRAERDINAFLGVVPGLLTLTVGGNLASNNDGYDFGGCLGFADETAYRAYCDHPLHVGLLDWLVPLIDAVELDLVAR